MKFSPFLFLSCVFLLSPVFAAQLSPTESKDVTVSVIGPPLVIVSSPESGTYFSNESLVLHVLHNADELWYTLGDGINVSLVNNTTPLDLAEGVYVLSVFGNNSYGETREDVNLHINLSAYLVLYDSFKGIRETTFFEAYPLERVEQLEAIVLENEFGQIFFQQRINVTDDSNASDALTDIDSGIVIERALASLDPTHLPNFDTSATVILYDLDFSNPEILRDGVVCPDSVCTLNYYTGNLSFNVSGFSTYSVRETPVQVPTTGGSGGGGGGGGGTFVRTLLFEISKDSLQFDLQQGETKRDVFEITNNGNRELSFELENDLHSLVRLSEEDLRLDPGESAQVFIDVFAPETQAPDLYLGKLIINGGGVSQNVLISVAVSSQQTLFDIGISIPQQYQEIFSNELLLAEITLLSIGREGRVDTNLTFQIQDERGNVVSERTETVAVDVQSSFVREFRLPSTVDEGNYALYVAVQYAGQLGSASQWFVVHKESVRTERFSAVIGAIVLAAVLFVGYYLGGKRRTRRRSKK